jgi:hypothetical protein
MTEFHVFAQGLARSVALVESELETFSKSMQWASVELTGLSTEIGRFALWKYLSRRHGRKLPRGDEKRWLALGKRLFWEG